MSKFFVAQSGLVAIRLDQVKYVENTGDEDTPEVTVYLMGENDNDYVELTSVEDIADLMKELKNAT